MKLEIRIGLPLAAYAVVDLDDLPGERPWLFWGTANECAEFVLQKTGGKPDDCPAADVWNCKYCRLVDKCKLHSHGEPKAYSELRLDNVGLVEHPIDEGTRIHQSMIAQEVMLQTSAPHRKLMAHPALAAPYDHQLDFYAELVRKYRAAHPSIKAAWDGAEKHGGQTVEWPIVLEDRVVEEQRATTEKFFAEMLAHYKVNDPFMYRAWTGRNPSEHNPEPHELPRTFGCHHMGLVCPNCLGSVRDYHLKNGAAFPQELAEAVRDAAQRYGVIKATTDWDTDHGAIRLRFATYLFKLTTWRMLNGELTHLWIDGVLCYDAH